MKKANVLRAIKNQLPHKCCYLSSNMLLKQIQKTNKQKNKTRKSQKLIKKEICRTNYSVKINFKFTRTTHNENRNVVDDATAKQWALTTGVAAEELQPYTNAHTHAHTHTEGKKKNIASGPCGRIHRSINII